MSNKNYFPCPVCANMLLVETTKNGKPYCKCNDCGVQLFIRGKLGIERLKRLLGQGRLRQNSKDLLSVLDHFRSLKERLEQIHDEKPLLGTDHDLELQERTVRAQLDVLRKCLEKGSVP